jgi:hypothetical protein
LEAFNGQAIIVTHIPYYECIHPYGVRLRAILERYQNVIRFSLSGHTHNEEFEVIRSLSDNKNIGINFIAGSLTTYTNFNPAFTVIELDAEYMLPLNFETYYFNLTEANNGGSPQWEQLHDFVNFYQIPDVSPDGMYALA